jgi:hypothetical protein
MNQLGPNANSASDSHGKMIFPVHVPMVLLELQSILEAVLQLLLISCSFGAVTPSVASVATGIGVTNDVVE